MGVEEDDAACYIESFKARYKGNYKDHQVHLISLCCGCYLICLTCIPGINTFLKLTVKNCIKDGFVQTLMGRKRYLAGITSTNAHIKAHVRLHLHDFI